MWIQRDRKPQTGCHMGQRHEENYTHRETPWAPSWSEITFLSAPKGQCQQSPKCCSNPHGLGDIPGHPHLTGVITQGVDWDHAPRVMKIKRSSEWKMARAKKSGALSCGRRSPRFTLDSQLLVPKMILGGLRPPRPEVGSQFPNQGLKPGCVSESTESLPLDQEGRWPASRP